MVDIPRLTHGVPGCVAGTSGTLEANNATESSQYWQDDKKPSIFSRMWSAAGDFVEAHSMKFKIAGASVALGAGVALSVFFPPVAIVVISAIILAAMARHPMIL